MKSRPAHPYWPYVLTDWCAIRAFHLAGCPDCLRESPELQAAFVAEISAYLRLWTLNLREAEAESRLLTATEAACEQAGGPAYGALRVATETARDDYFLTRARVCLNGGGKSMHVETDETRFLHARWQQCETELAALRRRYEPAARAARRQVAEAYWITVGACRIPEDFFADARPNSAPARMPHICATWWGLFVRWLRRVVRRTDPAVCRLLQQLPHLRVEAGRPGQKKVLTGLVEDWREANAERTGLLRTVHFPMLEQRAFEKWEEAEKWFEDRVPGFTTDSAVRQAAADSLSDHLARLPRRHPPSYWNN